MATIKEVAATANIATQVALRQTLVELKAWLDQNQSSNDAALKKVNDRLSTLIGTDEDGNKVKGLDGKELDVNGVIDTFNEIRDFLSGIEDTDMKSLLTRLNALKTDLEALISAEETRAEAAEATEKARAEAAEEALAARVKTLEDVEAMTAAQATALFQEVFSPGADGGEGSGD